MSPTPKPAHSLKEARFRQRRIGQALGLAYAEFVSEATPEDFLDLLAQADLIQPESWRPDLPSPSTMQHSRRNSSP